MSVDKLDGDANGEKQGQRSRRRMGIFTVTTQGAQALQQSPRTA
jgi:hypothetical protein